MPISLEEALQRKQKTLGDVFFGRFQPFHKGHAAAVDMMTNHPVIVLVKGAGTSLDKDRNPFTTKLQVRLIHKAFPQATVLVAKSGYLPEILAQVREAGYEPKHIFGGDDRKTEYQRQVDKANDGVAPTKQYDIEFVESPRLTSATAVREAITNNKQATFKKLMPKELWGEWEALRKVMLKEEVLEPNVEFLTENPDSGAPVQGFELIPSYDDSHARTFGFLMGKHPVSIGKYYHYNLSTYTRQAIDRYKTPAEQAKFFNERIKTDPTPEGELTGGEPAAREWFEYLQERFLFNPDTSQGWQEYKGRVSDYLKDPREVFAPSGRVWLGASGKLTDRETKVEYAALVSFWQRAARVTKQQIVQVLDHFNIPKSDWDKVLMDFLDTKHSVEASLIKTPNRKHDTSLLDLLQTGTEATTQKPAPIGSSSKEPIAKMSDEEERRLVAKGHAEKAKLTPAELKALEARKQRSLFGSKKAGLNARKAGFDNVASYNAFRKLSEDVLNESPDGPAVVKSFPRLRYYDSTAFPFMFLTDSKILITSTKSAETHDDIGRILLAAITGGSEALWTPESLESKRGLYVFAPPNEIGKLGKVMRHMKDRLADDDSFMQDWKYEIRELLTPSGRIWLHPVDEATGKTLPALVSWWHTQSEVDKSYLKVVLDAFKMKPSDYDKIPVEYLGAHWVEPVASSLPSSSDLLHNVKHTTHDTVELSDSELQRLKSIGHVNPNQLTPSQKRVLDAERKKSQFGSRKAGEIARKAGFDNVASLNALKNLSESPDEIHRPDVGRLHWSEPSSVTFGFFGHKVMFWENRRYGQLPHWAAMKTLADALPADTTSKEALRSWLNDATDGNFFVDIDAAWNHKEVFDAKWLVTAQKTAAASRDILAPCGRAWFSRKLISFWQKRSAVSKADLKTVLQNFNIQASDFDKWHIEFLDDDGSVNVTELSTGSDLISPAVAAAVTPKTIELSDEEERRLVAKAHAEKSKLTVDEKKALEARKKKSQFGSRKAGEIARKAGFDNVASYNAFRKLSEEQLISESPEQSFARSSFYHLDWTGPNVHAFVFLPTPGPKILVTSVEPGSIHDELAARTLSAFRPTYRDVDGKMTRVFPNEASWTPQWFAKECGIRFLGAPWSVVRTSLIEFKSQLDKNPSLFGKYDKDSRDAWAPSGRIWEHAKDAAFKGKTWRALISWWQRHEKVPNENLRLVLQAFDIPQSEWDNVLIEYMDNVKANSSKDLTPSSKLLGTSGQKAIAPTGKIDDVELQKLVAKGHVEQDKLSPAEKKVLADRKKKSQFGSRKAGEIARKAGFDNVASYNAFRKLSEGKLQLDDLIEESNRIKQVKASKEFKIDDQIEQLADASGFPKQQLRSIFEDVNRTARNSSRSLKTVRKFVTGDTSLRERFQEEWERCKASIVLTESSRKRFLERIGEKFSEVTTGEPIRPWGSSSAFQHAWRMDIPAYGKFLKDVFGDKIESKETYGYHVLSVQKLPMLKALEKSKKQVSVFLNKPTHGLFRGGVETNGGVLAILKGTVVGKSKFDVYSTPDEEGYRWLNLDHLMEFHGTADIARRFKKYAAQVFENILQQEPFKTAGEYGIVDSPKLRQKYLIAYIDGIRDVLKKNTGLRNALAAQLFNTSRAVYEALMENFTIEHLYLSLPASLLLKHLGKDPASFAAKVTVFEEDESDIHVWETYRHRNKSLPDWITASGRNAAFELRFMDDVEAEFYDAMRQYPGKKLDRG